MTSELFDFPDAQSGDSRSPGTDAAVPKWMKNYIKVAPYYVPFPPTVGAPMPPVPGAIVNTMYQIALPAKFWVRFWHQIASEGGKSLRSEVSHWTWHGEQQLGLSPLQYNNANDSQMQAAGSFFHQSESWVTLNFSNRFRQHIRWSSFQHNGGELHMCVFGAGRGSPSFPDGRYCLLFAKEADKRQLLEYQPFPTYP